MVYTLCNKYNNAHWQDESTLFKPAFTTNYGKVIDVYGDFQNIIRKSMSAKHPEVFIKHYKNHYNDPANPPAWMCFELLTVGELSRIFKGLNSNADRQLVANFFGLHHKVFTSWLHSLTYVRNICAHHSRLWNKELSIKPDLVKKPRLNWVSDNYNNNKRVFYFLGVLKYLMQSANTKNSFTEKLKSLIDKYPNVPVGFLGIPTNEDGSFKRWENEPLWEN
jgi:abortive infection bacteriophage resistance protein